MKGHALFEPFYSQNIGGPLSVLSSWLTGDANETIVIDYIQMLKHRMESMAANFGS